MDSGNQHPLGKDILAVRSCNRGQCIRDKKPYESNLSGKPTG